MPVPNLTLDVYVTVVLVHACYGVPNLTLDVYVTVVLVHACYGVPNLTLDVSVTMVLVHVCYTRVTWCTQIAQAHWCSAEFCS